MIYDIRTKNLEGKKRNWSLPGRTSRTVRGIKAGCQQMSSKKEDILAEWYEKVSNWGKQNDILEEIARLYGSDMSEICVHDVHMLKSRDVISEEHRMTKRNIIKYLKVDQLEEPLKEQLDDGPLPLVVAVDLSYLLDKKQKTVSGLAG